MRAIRALLWLGVPCLFGITQAVHAERKPEGKAKRFMAQTQTMLRDSSNTVGQAVAGVLSVQSGLDEMKEDLAGEYALWQQKQLAFARDKERLTGEVKRLQAAIAIHNSFREEKLRLQGELALHEAESTATNMANDQVRLRWKMQKQQSELEIQRLEVELNASQTLHSLQVAALLNRTNQHRDDNQDLQQRILRLSVKVRKIENVMSNQSVASKREQSELLAKVQALQEEIHGLQKEMVFQAQLRAEQQGLEEQTNEVIAQREEIKAAWNGCAEELKKLDSLIGSNKGALVSASRQLVACQGLDAENQRLQDRVNQCRAEHRSGNLQDQFGSSAPVR